MAKLPHSEDLSDLLPKEGGGYALIAVGVQECTQLLSVCFVQLSLLFLALIPLSSLLCAAQTLVSALHKHLGPSYYIVGKKSLWEIKLIVFAHRPTLPYGSVVSGVQTDSVATGMLHIMGNKGAVAVCCRVWGTSVCFVNSHLAPHDHRYDARYEVFASEWTTLEC
jgi:hypothetical protein